MESSLTKILRWPVFLVAIAFSLPSVSTAQENPVPDTSVNKRERSTPDRYPVLNGHRFFSTVLIGSPFVQSTIGSSIGGGTVSGLNFTIRNPINDSTRTLRGDLGFLSIELLFQHALDDYVSLHLKVNMVERIATHEESLLSQGVSGEGGFEAGMRVKIWTNEQFYVSLVGSYTTSTFVAVTPLEFLKDVLEEGLQSPGNNSLVKQVETDRFVFGADVAFAPAPYLGFIGHVDIGTANAFEDGPPNIPVSSAGLSAHLDLGSLTNIPLGISLGILTNSLTPGADDIATRTTSFIYGISYTGWQDFDFGLEASSTRLSQRNESNTFGANFARLRMSFYY